jgi:fumarylpyruvate hydrolase
MRYVVDPPAQPALAVAGEEAFFPVGRIFCVGQNYADHVREMGGDPARGTPIFFDKPASALVASGATIPFPPATRDLHHEMELAVALRSGGADLAREQAAQAIYGYAAALDMTRRDLQAAAKASGKPWDMAKGFDNSAPCGPVTPMPGKVLTQGSIELRVNGRTRQSGDLNQMVWGVDEIITELSRLVELRAGDLILTGTPAGVSAVAPGDALEGTIAGVGAVSIRYAG